MKGNTTMKQTFYNTYFFIVLASLWMFTACYNLDNMSHNPYEIEANASEQGEEKKENDKTKYADINLNYSITKADTAICKKDLASAASTFRNFLYEGYYNDYQTTTNLTHDVYSGYIAYNQPKHADKSPAYNYTDGWSAQRWAHFYNDRSKEYRELVRAFKFNNTPKRYKNMFYVTRIYYTFLALANTDTYGDMPFKVYVQAKVPKTNNVPYNTQQQVYDAMFRMLEQAVDSIAPDDANQYSVEKDDICYKGDWYKWLRFANSLRLRMALRISNIDPARAQKEGEAALANQYGLMQNNDDNMKTIPKYAPIDMGGTNDGGNENVITMCSIRYNGECVMSYDLEQYYRNLSTGGGTYKIKKGKHKFEEKTIDPRCLVCWFRGNMTQQTIASGTESLRDDYKGCKRGAQVPDISMAELKYSLVKCQPKPLSKTLNPNYWFNDAQPTVWLGYAETLFLKAEAALRGWKGATESVENFFRAGVQASMDYYQIKKNFAQSYIDGLKVLKEGVFLSGDKERMLQAIITQKWMAIFPNGNEGWAEFRRTEYPTLLNSVKNLSGGDVAKGKHIKRLLYPNSENSNQYFLEHTNLATANSQGKRLWWDVSDTNDENGNPIKPNNFR